MAKAHDALGQVIGEYKTAYAKDPRFRRVLAALDGALHESTRLHPKASESPGARSAREAALSPSPGAQTPREAPQSPQATPQPQDFAAAREMASERFRTAS